MAYKLCPLCGRVGHLPADCPWTKASLYGMEHQIMKIKLDKIK